MIIQCEQCQTKYKLDDSKVADKSIKVRCARCRHVFPVSGPQAVSDDSASFTQNAPVFQIEEDQEVTAASPMESTLAFESETQAEEESFDDSSLLDTFSFEAEDEQSLPETPPPADHDSDFSFPSVESAALPDRVETQQEEDTLDFGEFDFGDDSGDGAEPAAATMPLDFVENTSKQEPVATLPKDDFGGLDFSGDDMFGDVVSTVPEEEAVKPISFDMGMDGFADSMGIESSAPGQGASFAAQDQAAETPFSLDDIDFGDELTSVAVQQVSTEELKPSQELLFAPLAAAQTNPALDSFTDTLEKTSAVSAQEELPPLSITSRRKESPRVSGMLVFMGVIIAVLVIFYAIWGYMTLNENKGQTTTQEAGRITVRSVEASFIKNNKTGDLLVISGEAVNEYNKPRAAIQIKGIVFGADGAEISSKSAFCGNPLTNEQLGTLPLDKIEAAMANQFGDSLANMEVAPGDAIPFMIVMPKPPAAATDYGVEPAGSTVATGKDK
jgi:predicted Zn finger-like uncharacterized protein